MNINTLYTLLKGNHVILESDYYVGSVSMIDESMIARRPSGWFSKTDNPHVDINADRWGSIQAERFAVNQDGSIMIWDDEGNNWNLQVLTPMDKHQVDMRLEEIGEDE